MENQNTTLIYAHLTLAVLSGDSLHGAPQDPWPVPRIGFSHTCRLPPLGRVLEHPISDALQLQPFYQSAHCA